MGECCTPSPRRSSDHARIRGKDPIVANRLHPEIYTIDHFEAVDDSTQVDPHHLPQACAVLTGAPDREWHQYFLESARQVEQARPGMRLELLADRLRFYTRAATAEDSCSAVVAAVRDTNRAYLAVREAENRRMAQRRAEVEDLGKRLKAISKSLEKSAG
jgi:phosphoenolpyruvate-protein kinase (PTS system EI component)